MTKTEIIVLVIGSGLAAGLVSGVVTLLSGIWERRHRSQERAAVAEHEALLRQRDEEHEARLRREAAHDGARIAYLPIAEEFQAWAEQNAHRVYSDETGEFIHVSTNRPLPAMSEDVVDCLRKIKFGHPSKRVREHARSLCSHVEAQWTEFTAAGSTDPTVEEALDWADRAESLIELIHAPEDAEAPDPKIRNGDTRL